MTDKVIVYTTCGNITEAESIARNLIDNRLAACVNVVPGLLSYYRWQGKVENDTELLLMIKTAGSLIDEVRNALETLHSYDLPEMIVLPIIGGSPNYLEWLEQEVQPESPAETAPEAG
ncbi:MAG: divalent-cation tolerance protein CutA [Bryobacterales bacterium]|nr:divalent-cation tolerance protein CutA [Bryobacterales bacterium]MDE0293541.1 divalent-cation tolerance protein CutA [Bryobacterales bacterium]